MAKAKKKVVKAKVSDTAMAIAIVVMVFGVLAAIWAAQMYSTGSFI